MKLQLKRSNVLESSAAKEPTAAQLEYGELAINYNTNDPAIFLKDSNNNVIRISGIGNIADDGQVELPASNTPPLNPQPGNLWYNSEDGRLYIYYKDPDTEQWVDASPDSWDPSSYPDVSDDDAQAGTLDDRYLMLNADNSPVTGNLALNQDLTVGGSASFAGNVTTSVSGLTGPGFLEMKKEGNIRQRYDGSQDNTYAHALYSLGTNKDELNYILRSTGNIEIGGNLDASRGLSNPNISLRATDGSASFAGEITVGSDAVSTNGAFLSPNGVVRACRDGSNSIFVGRSTTEGLTSQIDADGSAEFAGDITLKRTANVYAKLDGTSSVDFDITVNAGRANNEGRIKFRGSRGGGALATRSLITSQGSMLIGGSLDEDAGSETPNISLSHDGSAEFAGNINGSQNADFGSYATDGVRANGVRIYAGSTTGQLLISSTRTDSGLIAKFGANASIGGDGSATFAGGNIQILSTGGITFNGDTAQANALDDYEEGSWTPTLTTNNPTSGSITYSTGGNRQGSYIKIGNTVVLTCTLGWTANTIAGGSDCFVGGIPFAFASADSCWKAQWLHWIR